MSRLEKLSDAKVLGIAKLVVEDFPDDQLRAAIEQLDKDGHIISDITRHHLAEALDEFSLAGKRDLVDLLRKHWPAIDQTSSVYVPFETLMDDRARDKARSLEYVNNSAGRPAAAAEPARESPTGAPQEGVGSLSARAPTELIPTASLKKLGDRTARSPPCRRVRSRLRPYRRPRSYTAQLLAKILLPIRRDIRVPSRAAAT